MGEWNHLSTKRLLCQIGTAHRSPPQYLTLLRIFLKTSEMFEYGEGRTTRSSIRSLKDDAAVKYITRATLQRASGSEERKSGILAKNIFANPKMNDQTKASHSRSSSISSEQERNLSTRSEDEGFGSPSILPTIPTVLARPHHRLNQVTFCLQPTCNLQHEF